MINIEIQNSMCILYLVFYLYIYDISTSNYKLCLFKRSEIVSMIEGYFTTLLVFVYFYVWCIKCTTDKFP